MFKPRHRSALMAFALISQLAMASVLAQTSKDPNLVEDVGFDARVQSLILVPVKLGDRTYQFAVDTGSSHHVFDKSLVSQLGPVRRTRSIGTPNGLAEIDTYDSPRAFLGSINLQTPDLVCTADLGNIRKATASEVHGIIGMSFLKNHVVEIDFEAQRFKFLKRANAGSAIGKQPITFDEKKKIPFIEIELPELGKHSFLVDTGFGNSLQIARSDFDQLVKNGNLRSVESLKVTDISGSHVMKYGKLSRVVFKGFFFRDVGVYETSGDDRVGLSLLRGLHCTFDFPGSVLYFSKKAPSVSVGH